MFQSITCKRLSNKIYIGRVEITNVQKILRSCNPFSNTFLSAPLLLFSGAHFSIWIDFYLVPFSNKGWHRIREHQTIRYMVYVYHCWFTKAPAYKKKWKQSIEDLFTLNRNQLYGPILWMWFRFSLSFCLRSLKCHVILIGNSGVLRTRSQKSHRLKSKFSRRKCGFILLYSTSTVFFLKRSKLNCGHFLLSVLSPFK